MFPFGAYSTKETVLQYNKEKLYYDDCHAAPVLEWMSQKWTLVAMKQIGEASVKGMAQLCQISIQISLSEVAVLMSVFKNL